MTAMDLEDLLKTRTVFVPDNAVLYLFVLDTAQQLRNEKQGNTISKIFSSNPNWVGQKVSVLPKDDTKGTPVEVIIELEKSLQPDQMEFHYFNVVEVEEF